MRGLENKSYEEPILSLHITSSAVLLLLGEGKLGVRGRVGKEQEWGHFRRLWVHLNSLGERSFL